MQTTNQQNGDHVPRRHKLIRFAHQACRDLGIVYWRPRQRGALLDKGPHHDAAEVEPTYQLGDHDAAEAEAQASKAAAKSSPSTDSIALRAATARRVSMADQPLRGILRHGGSKSSDALDPAKDLARNRAELSRSRLGLGLEGVIHLDASAAPAEGNGHDGADAPLRDSALEAFPDASSELPPVISQVRV
jgi:hypothetical protein